MNILFLFEQAKFSRRVRIDRQIIEKSTFLKEWYIRLNISRKDTCIGLGIQFLSNNAASTWFPPNAVQKLPVNFSEHIRILQNCEEIKTSSFLYITKTALISDRYIALPVYFYWKSQICSLHWYIKNNEIACFFN